MSVQTLNIPEGVPSDGTVRVDFVPTLTDPLAATLAELTGSTAEMIGCHLFGIGMGANTERKEKRRLCSRNKYELLGATTYTIDALNYVYDVQNPESDTNAAYAALVPRTTGFLVVRWGIDAGEPLAEGQVVDIFPIRLGQRIKQAPEENDELTVSQEVVVIGDPVEDYVIPAA